MEVGGRPLVRLEVAGPSISGPSFLSAEILPGRGMMLLQARAAVPGRGEIDVLVAPPAEAAARLMDGGPDDFMGNKSFDFGGAILLPYANRIQGRGAGDREIIADLGYAEARLPANWGGKAPGAPTYAMHGLMLATPFRDVRRIDAGRVIGRWQAGDFGGRWPSRSEVTIGWTLTPRTLELKVTVVNAGGEDLPMGVGWHPYFKLPSGERRQARLHVPARNRLEVGDYDAVLPTGRVLPAAAAYDFRAREGRALGELYLDDCFVDLARPDGDLRIEITDPLAGYGVRLATPSPAVKAVQLYAPPGDPFVVVEPQFNWADPFSSIWPPGTDTGMARLSPGDSCSYKVVTELFAPEPVVPARLNSG